MAYTAFNPLVITIDNPAPAAVSATLVRPVKVVDSVAYVTTAAAAATSCTISSTGGNITNSIGLGNNAANKVGRAGEIDDANNAIPSGATVTSTWAGAGTAGRASIICVSNA